MDVLIFDTETTDLVSNSLLPLNKQPYMTEFYGHILNEKYEVIDKLHFMCKPPISLPAMSVKITGITDETIADELPFQSQAGNLQRFINLSDAVVAHNLSYDMAIIDFEMRRSSRKTTWPIVRICTVEQTEWLKGHRLSLTMLHEYIFDEPHKGAHRAKKDVEALTRCYIALRNNGDI